MRRCWLKCVALVSLILIPVVRAQAQTVFFDDFDDPALPQWNLPDPAYWQYDVNNSMLNVTGLFFPSNPKSNVNYAGMSASFAPQGDFQMDVWMGWNDGQGPHRVEAIAQNQFGGLMAWTGYRNEGLAGPEIFAGGGARAGFNMPAPPPGIHHFTISRTGS